MTDLLAPLPDAPKVELEIVRETLVGEGGFLALRRTALVAVYDGARSPEFAYDLVERRALDASVMAAHHEHEGRVWVWLRSSLRPPIALRPGKPGEPRGAVLWELPAGLIEAGETPRAAAARELAEELGFVVAEAALAPLGPTGFPCPAAIGEKHHFFHVRVDPASRGEPSGDGSPVEAGAVIIAVPLDEALAAARRGELADEKTELALRRLAELLS